MTPKNRERLYTILQKANPNPKSELRFSTPFELLVAVILSAQATDKSVNLATEKLFKKANTPQKIVKLGVKGLEPYIQKIGLFHAKARHVVAMAQLLIENFNGTVPDTFEDLVTLPGVGAKTANVVLNVAFDQATIPVDTHVFRVAHRLGLAKGKTPDEVGLELVRITPPVFLKNAHHWLLLHGRYCCKARNPLCETCPVKMLCPTAKNQQNKAFFRQKDLVLLE